MGGGEGDDKFHSHFYCSDLNSISFPKSPTAKLFLVIRLLKLSANKGWGWGGVPPNIPSSPSWVGIFPFPGWHCARMGPDETLPLSSPACVALAVFPAAVFHRRHFNRHCEEPHLRAPGGREFLSRLPCPLQAICVPSRERATCHLDVHNHPKPPDPHC